MSNKAWISVGVFVVLLVLVFATREDKVSVGMRTLTLPAIAKIDVVKIEVSGKHEALLEKADQGWLVSSPDKPEKKVAAEMTAVEGALDGVNELAAGNFVTARKEKHAELELDDEKGTRVRVTGKDGAVLDVVLGRFAQGGGNYLRLQDKSEVFVGKGKLGSTVKKDMSGWRKRKMVDVELEQVASVLVEPAGGPSYTVVASEAPSAPASEGDGEQAGAPPTPTTQWGFGADVALPAGFVVDSEQLKRIATSIIGLRAADFVDDEKGPEVTGLSDKPTLGRAVVKTKGGAELALRFGSDDDKKRTHVVIEGDAQVYLANNYSVKNAIKQLDELRDLSLARFSAADVERAVLTSAKETVELARKDGAWTLAQPATPPAGYQFDAAGVEAKLTALSKLKAQERLEVPPASSGLDKPGTVITLFLKDGSEKRIAYGADAPDKDGSKRVYAQGAEEPNVYVVPMFQRNRYEKPLDLFKTAPPPPPGQGGHGISGMDSLPPDVRKKLEESLKSQGLPGK